MNVVVFYYRISGRCKNLTACLLLLSFRVMSARSLEEFRMCVLLLLGLLLLLVQVLSTTTDDGREWRNFTSASVPHSIGPAFLLSVRPQRELGLFLSSYFFHSFVFLFFPLFFPFFNVYFLLRYGSSSVLQQRSPACVLHVCGPRRIINRGFIPYDIVNFNERLSIFIGCPISPMIICKIIANAELIFISLGEFAASTPRNVS